MCIRDSSRTLSTCSSSTPVKNVVLPAMRKPPVVANLVTWNPFLVNALETAALSSLLTIASTSFIEKSPYLSCFKGKEAFPFYFSTFAEEKPYLIRNSAAFSEITSPGITTGTPGGQGQEARAAILPTARFIGTSSLGESTAFLGETACPETGGIRRPMARGCLLYTSRQAGFGVPPFPVYRKRRAGRWASFEP